MAPGTRELLGGASSGCDRPSGLPTPSDWLRAVRRPAAWLKAWRAGRRSWVEYAGMDYCDAKDLGFPTGCEGHGRARWRHE
jgi:hypothetical protein